MSANIEAPEKTHSYDRKAALGHMIARTYASARTEGEMISLCQVPQIDALLGRCMIILESFRGKLFWPLVFFNPGKEELLQDIGVLPADKCLHQDLAALLEVGGAFTVNRNERHTVWVRSRICAVAAFRLGNAALPSAP